jgi:hypothetical protein
MKKKNFLEKKWFCNDKQTKLLEGRESGCLEFGPCWSSGRYEVIKSTMSKLNKQANDWIYCE